MSGETSAGAFWARHNGRLSDKALIKFIADGDKDALKLLYLRHRAQIYQFVLRLNGSETVADEAVNQVFLAVWRNAGQFKGESQVATWLLGIARYRGLSYCQRLSMAAWPSSSGKQASIAHGGAH